MYTNSSTEYWGGGRSAALTHTTLDGKEDAKLPDNVRIYHFSGTQHSPSLEGTANRLTAKGLLIRTTMPGVSGRC